jgi:hypothetical protein
MIEAFVVAAALAGPIDVDVRVVAALPGEPSVVSAGGITRRDTPMATLENPSPFEPPAAARRLVLIGGLDGDEASARAVIDAVRWIKSEAPAAVRRSWIVSAMPLVEPDGHALPPELPPEKGFFDDPEAPESRYLWRWLSYQAPDQVVVFSQQASAPVASLTQALTADLAAGLGSVAVSQTGTSLAAFRDWLLAVTGRRAPPATPALRRPARGASRGSAAGSETSRMHEAIAKRVARPPLAVAQLLARRYPETPGISYELGRIRNAR